jgi:hypothetical protein
MSPGLLQALGSGLGKIVNPSTQLQSANAVPCRAHYLGEMQDLVRCAVPGGSHRMAVTHEKIRCH